MGDPSTLDSLAPVADRITKPSAFRLDAGNPGFQSRLNRANEFGNLTPAERRHVQQIACLAPDRRLAHHAMRNPKGGRA